jgi:hypothetical protein
MADIEVFSAELKDGVLTVTGAGFTKTTTFVFLDDEDDSTPFEALSDTEIQLNVDSVTELTIQKGDVSRTITVARGTASAEGGGEDSSSEPYDPSGSVHEEGYKTAEPNQTPGDLVEDDLKTTSDASVADINAVEERRRAQEANAPDRTPLKEGEHLPGADFRTRVENTMAGDITKIYGPRDPYPKDNPPDHRESFHRIHGYYPSDEGGGEQAAQMDADPKT